MLDDRVRSTLAIGSSHLAAVSTAGGSPLAMRGWGATPRDTEPLVRVLLDAADVGRLIAEGTVLEGSWIAYTAASVRSLTSFQLKGRMTSVQSATDDDRATYAAYCDEYFAAVLAVDFVSRELMERMEPDDIVAVEFVVEELFDQSPGPRAGQAYEVGS